ncbi:hypothetical protein BB560_004686 [Smittium megazygosporum]|uniref:1-phosphatidylinositol 4-kinase n=1 Tax=Smittium megazygosporum TaxID=133381 RepID=A0A2T9Z8J2_9FUNG|nr:hypothetical protein BB560_004686 [Smittium megazygosporum]
MKPKSSSQMKKTQSSLPPIDYEKTNSLNLLLRFFQSDLFTIRFAILYLYRYLGIVGIQHFICETLLFKFQPSEIEPYLPQLVHICINYPSASISIERLLIELSLRDSHLCLQLHWFLQSYLLDLSSVPKTPRFKVCLRLFNANQELLLFNSNLKLLGLVDTTSLQSSLQRGSLAIKNVFLLYKMFLKNSRKKSSSSKNKQLPTFAFLAPQIRENSLAAIVGMSSIAASPAAPLQTPFMQVLAVRQGFQPALNLIDITPPNLPPSNLPISSESSVPVSRDNSLSVSPRRSLNIPKSFLSAQDFKSTNSSQLSFGSENSSSGSSSPPSPEFLSIDNIFKSNSLNSRQIEFFKSLNSKLISDTKLTKRHRLQQQSYFSKQLEFTSQLSEISKRLVPISPKSARQTSLLVELNTLNHYISNNPTCCIPMLCSYHKHRPSNEATFNDNHDCIIRIPTQEAVVLNSAEHSPYLVLLEVLRANPSEPPSSKPLVSQSTLLPDTPSKSLVDKILPQDNIISPYNNHSLAKGSTNGSLVNPGKDVLPNSLLENNSPPSSSSQAQSLPSKNHKSQNSNKCILNNLPPPPYSEKELEERMRSASVLLSQLNKLQLSNKTFKSNPSSMLRQKQKQSAPNIWARSLYKLASITAPTAPKQEKNIATVQYSLFSALLSPTQNKSTPSSSMSAFDTNSANRKSYPPQSRFPSEQNSPYSLPVSPPAQLQQNDMSPDHSSSFNSNFNNKGPRSKSLYDIHDSPNSHQIRAKTVFEHDKNPISDLSTTISEKNNLELSKTSEPSRSSLQDQKPDTSENKPDYNTEQGVDPNILVRDNLIKELLTLQEIRSTYYNPCAYKLSEAGFVKEPIVPQHSVSKVEEVAIEEVDHHGDKSATVLGEDWESKKERIRKSSPFGHLENWDLISVIVKEGTDLRQEKFALQLINEMKQLLEIEGIKSSDIFIQSYDITVTGQDSGLVETLNNSISLHSIKKTNKGMSLYDYFIKTYGTKDTEMFKKAHRNFMASLVGYSLVCYLLQLKDRHNGNILLTSSGHLIHIDFGFMLNNSPGAIGFETAPFKLTSEYVDLLTCNMGIESELFTEFKLLLKTGFLALRKHSDYFISLVQMVAKNSTMPCLTDPSSTSANNKAGDKAGYSLGSNNTTSSSNYGTQNGAKESLPKDSEAGSDNQPGFNLANSGSREGSASLSDYKGFELYIDSVHGTFGENSKTAKLVLQSLKDRFFQYMSDAQVSEHVEKLISSSYNNVNTIMYDNFQYYSNGIL